MSSKRLEPSLPPKTQRWPPFDITAECALRSAGNSPSTITTVHRLVPVFIFIYYYYYYFTREIIN